MVSKIRTSFISKSLALIVTILLSASILLSPALAGDADDKTKAVLAANSEFYRAFRESDMPAMEAVWATDPKVAVIHPGWPQLNGYEDVLLSWRMILENPLSPKIRSTNATVKFKDGSAFVTTDEIIGSGIIRAMNIYQLHDGKWEMVFHGAVSSTASQT